MTGKLGNSTCIGVSTKKTQERKSWFSSEKRTRDVALKMILLAIKDLSSSKIKIRGEAALFIASSDYDYWCEKCGIDSERLSHEIKSIVSHPVGARRRRLTADLLKEIQEES